ncbi:Werner Syndrome-like exonuclease [Vitis vinifera]|uniref:Werner Syndrome-like exonuclease n=1 Tax=Vitis vinifera TaxID=29760 RepID=A0A438CKT2_VITVI|nr:Werner Syndrome-like exonuclease [Vitis vinifera]
MDWCGSSTPRTPEYRTMNKERHERKAYWLVILLKPNKIRLGNWEADVLSKAQLEYAATDAFASWYLYEVLKSFPDTAENKIEELEGDLKCDKCAIDGLLEREGFTVGASRGGREGGGVYSGCLRGRASQHCKRVGLGRFSGSSVPKP